MRGYYGIFAPFLKSYGCRSFAGILYLISFREGDKFTETASAHGKYAVFTGAFEYFNLRTMKLEEIMANANNDKKPANSIRLTPEQWATCDSMTKQLGLKSRNDFIRDAVDFYIAWQSRESVERVLTPALESVISAKIRDTEERLTRILFKLAVDQNLLARFLARYDGYDDDAIDEMRVLSLNQVKRTNGTIDADHVLKEREEWQD